MSSFESDDDAWWMAIRQLRSKMVNLKNDEPFIFMTVSNSFCSRYSKMLANDLHQHFVSGERGFATIHFKYRVQNEVRPEVGSHIFY